MPLVGAIFLLLITYGGLHIFGKSWAESSSGYLVGNRHRLLSVWKMEIVLLLLNIFVYRQLMQWFELDDMRARNKCGVTVRRQWRDRCSICLITFLFLSQMIYFMYYTPAWMQNVFFDFTTIACGMWTNLLAFVCGFWLINILIVPFNAIFFSRWIITQVSRIPYLKRLIYERREQIKFTIWFSLVLSFVMCYSSDKVVVKNLEIPVNNLTAIGGKIRFAVVSDIHAGASVYSDEVARVVDNLLSLNVDAVLLVGDMIDGPVQDIIDRVTPLWVIAQRFPTFFVSGNHEYYYGNALEWMNLFSSKGITVLGNNATTFKGICLAGVNDIATLKAGIAKHEMNVSLALSFCPPVGEASRVLLAHNPATVREMEKEDMESIDFMISGHTHAGQFYVVFPVVYWMLPYFYGLYDLPSGTGKLMVSAGTLYQGPPMKMLRMSEIWVITLTNIVG